MASRRKQNTKSLNSTTVLNAEEIRKKTKSRGTNNQYSTEIKRIKTILEIPPNEEIELPLDKERIDFMLQSVSFKKNKQPNLWSTVEHYTAAFKDYCNTRNKPLSQDQIDLMKSYVEGLKRYRAETDKAGETTPVNDAKLPITPEAFDILCSHAIREVSVSGVHLIGTLCWNLLARSAHVVDLCFDYLTWREDCLAVRLLQTKGDQGGERGSIYLHVYSNPYKPECCAILALALHVFSYPNLNKSLFEHTDIKQAYGRWLRSLFQAFGTEAENGKALV
jgi:hypothetical protein